MVIIGVVVILRFTKNPEQQTKEEREISGLIPKASGKPRLCSSNSPLRASICRALRFFYLVVNDQRKKKQVEIVEIVFVSVMNIRSDI